MLRHSPLGFLLGTTIEVAAIVFLVSLLPRADLRPAVKPDESPTISPVSWNADLQQPSAPSSASRQPAPSLIESSPQRRDYVEQRLDRASQQLVNSVGSFVTQTADQALAKPVLPTNSSPFIGTGVQPSPAGGNRPGSGSVGPQHRPWIRY